MNRCLITYEDSGRANYTRSGLKQLSPRLEALRTFPYSAEDQRKQAALRAAKMSIQGVQPKLSAKLNIKESRFEVVDRGGLFILKPQHDVFPELPENEDLTMRLASVSGIEIPLHGMVHCEDGTRTYFVKRFDRYGKGKKYALEDFAQLAEKNRTTKYDYSIEKMILLLDHCTFPAVERAALFKRLLFNYLVGNEDMHLKNFSLITRGRKTSLSPAYDFLNSTIAYEVLGKSKESIEEVALPLKGKKRNLTKKDWLDYLAVQRMGLTAKSIDGILLSFQSSFVSWDEWIRKSFLSEPLKDLYVSLIFDRRKVLGL